MITRLWDVALNEEPGYMLLVKALCHKWFAELSRPCVHTQVTIDCGLSTCHCLLIGIHSGIKLRNRSLHKNENWVYQSKVS